MGAEQGGVCAEVQVGESPVLRVGVRAWQGEGIHVGGEGGQPGGREPGRGGQH